MRKALVTGISGFVGPYLKRELEDNGYEVLGLDRHGGGQGVLVCDITDYASVFKAVEMTKPDLVLHLAGFSSVSRSFEEPEMCRRINVTGTKNLLDAISGLGLKPKILVISSADVYGEPEHLPIDEKHPLNPVSPYGKSRAEQEKLALSYELPVTISRSFNHTGRDQPDSFVIPSFRKQVEEAEDGGTIRVGNLDIVRDFSDVRDVVRAYRLLLEKGKAGEIYNVGSGTGHSLRDILDMFIRETKKRLVVKVDDARLRKDDISRQVAGTAKISSLGISLRDYFSGLSTS